MMHTHRHTHQEELNRTGSTPPGDTEGREMGQVWDRPVISLPGYKLTLYYVILRQRAQLVYFKVEIMELG